MYARAPGLKTAGDAVQGYGSCVFTSQTHAFRGPSASMVFNATIISIRGATIYGAEYAAHAKKERIAEAHSPKATFMNPKIWVLSNPFTWSMLPT
jgi:hypothetical protein